MLSWKKKLKSDLNYVKYETSVRRSTSVFRFYRYGYYCMFKKFDSFFVVTLNIYWVKNSWPYSISYWKHLAFWHFFLLKINYFNITWIISYCMSRKSYIASYYMNWVKTSLTFSIMNLYWRSKCLRQNVAIVAEETIKDELSATHSLRQTVPVYAEFIRLPGGGQPGYQLQPEQHQLLFSGQFRVLPISARIHNSDKVTTYSAKESLVFDSKFSDRPQILHWKKINIKCWAGFAE